MTTIAAEESNLGQAQPTSPEPVNPESTNAEPINSQVTEQPSEDAHYKKIEIGSAVDVNQEFVIKKATIDTLTQSLGRCYYFFKRAYTTNRGSGVLSPDQIRFYEQLVKQPGFNDTDSQALAASLDAFVRDGGQNVKYAMALAEWEKMALQLATGKTIQVLERADSKKYIGSGVVSNEPEGTAIIGAHSSLEAKFIETHPNAGSDSVRRKIAALADKFNAKLNKSNSPTEVLLREQGIKEAEEKGKKQKISYYVKNNGLLNEVRSTPAVKLSADQQAFIKFYFTQEQESLSLTNRPDFEKAIDERLIQITEAQIDFFTATLTDRGFLSQASQEHILNFIDVDNNGNRTLKMEGTTSTLEINKSAREEISQKIAAKVGTELNRASLMQSADTARSSVNKYIETLKTNQLTQIEVEQKNKLEQKKANLQKDLETANQLKDIDAKIADLDRQITEKSPKTTEEIQAIERTLSRLRDNLGLLNKNKELFTKVIGEMHDQLNLIPEKNKAIALSSYTEVVKELNQTSRDIMEMSGQIAEQVKLKEQKGAVTDSEEVEKLKKQREEYKEKRKLLLGRKHSMPSPAKIMADIAKTEEELAEFGKPNEERKFQQSVYETLSSEVLEVNKFSEIHSRAMEAEALVSLPKEQGREWNEVPEILKSHPPCYLRTLQILFGTEVTYLDNDSNELFKKATDLLPEKKFADFIKNYLGRTENDQFDIKLSEHVNSVSPNFINSLLFKLIEDAKNFELGKKDEEDET